MAAQRRLFLADTGILIPQSWNNFLAPATVPLHPLLDSVETTFIFGAQRYSTLLAEPSSIYQGTCYDQPKAIYEGHLRFQLNADSLGIVDHIKSSEHHSSSSIYTLESPENKSLENKPDVVVKNPLFKPGVAKRKKSSDLTDTSSSSTFKRAHIGASAVTGDGDNFIATKKILYNGGDVKMVHGFVGFFTSQLYKEKYCIDTRQCVSSWNCFHWESFLFPLQAPICIEEHVTVNFQIKRLCEKIDSVLELKGSYPFKKENTSCHVVFIFVLVDSSSYTCTTNLRT